MSRLNTQGTEHRDASLTGYYKLHAKIYDATRWTFLFGRKGLVDLLGRTLRPKRILEIGCGTGRNLAQLGQVFPNAHLTGLDLSAHMLEKADCACRDCSERVELVKKAYDQPLTRGEEGLEPFDLIVFSYALTMFNPGYDTAIAAAREDLSPEGRIAVVDFHDSPVPAFKTWMGKNHVRMDAHLLPTLLTHFAPETERVDKAYLGLWRYLTFIGKAR